MAAVWRDYGGRREETGVERRRASRGLLASLHREEASRRLPLRTFELAATCKWEWRRRHAPMLMPSEVSRQRLTECGMDLCAPMRSLISPLPSLPVSCHPRCRLSKSWSFVAWRANNRREYRHSHAKPLPLSAHETLSEPSLRVKLWYLILYMSRSRKLF